MKICSLFMKTSDVHSHSTSFSTSSTFYINALEVQRIGATLWNEIPRTLSDLLKGLSKQGLKNSLLHEYAEQRKCFS